MAVSRRPSLVVSLPALAVVGLLIQGEVSL